MEVSLCWDPDKLFLSPKFAWEAGPYRIKCCSLFLYLNRLMHLKIRCSGVQGIQTCQDRLPDDAARSSILSLTCSNTPSFPHWTLIPLPAPLLSKLGESQNINSDDLLIQIEFLIFDFSRNFSLLVLYFYMINLKSHICKIAERNK